MLIHYKNFMTPLRRCLPLLLALLLALPLTARASTEAVFAAHRGAVVQLRLLDIQSGAQHSMGSGFHVGDGLIVTNYHVIADLLDKHGRYRAEAKLFDDRATPLTLRALDVVHDLALVQAATPPPNVLAFSAQPPAHGERLYSFGIPLDLGFTIVEGTHNGAVKGSRLQSMHFTGSLNPGMSGGPALRANGEVAGINVASSGDQVSYLVPAAPARALVEAFRRGPQTPATRSSLLADVRRQLLAEQDRVVSALLAKPLPRVPLGRFEVPDTGVSWIECWGDSLRKEHILHTATRRFCNSNDNIFLGDELNTGEINYTHIWLDGHALGRARFLHLFGKSYARSLPSAADDDEQSAYSCQQEFFRQDGIAFRSALCLRAYKEHAGLYDVAFVAASQLAEPEGLLTTLRATGISLPNAKRLIAAHIDALRLRRP